jgi:hypothetical protein
MRRWQRNEDYGSWITHPYTIVCVLLLLLYAHDVADVADDCHDARRPTKRARRLPPGSMFGAGHPVRRSQAYRNSHYWRSYVDNPDACIPGTYAYRRFRATFRVPYELFSMMVSDAKAARVGLHPNPKKRGRPAAPMELKVLGCLRRLAIGCPYDQLFADTEVAPGVHRRFFKAWLPWMLETYYDKNVRMPSTEKELRAAEHVYNLCGLPGCVTSMDGVHVEWNRAPHATRFAFTVECQRQQIPRIHRNTRNYVSLWIDLYMCTHTYT